MSNLSIAGEIILIQLGFSMMARKYAKKRDSWGMAAIQSLERIIGTSSEWSTMSTIAIQMMSADYEPRQILYDTAMDLLHDITCKLFPELDDGERLYETGGG